MFGDHHLMCLVLKILILIGRLCKSGHYFYQQHFQLDFLSQVLILHFILRIKIITSSLKFQDGIVAVLILASEFKTTKNAGMNTQL